MVAPSDRAPDSLSPGEHERNAAAIDAGWWSHARRLESPNQDQRPPGTTIDLLVVHGISLPPGRFGGPWIDHLFSNTLPPEIDPFFASLKGLRVSAHALVRRDGEVVQYVPFHQRAWHAGVSSFQDRPACNDYSIGIELEGTDHLPYAANQYRALARIAHAAMQHYPAIHPSRIVGHSHIAPGRKTDPGPAFDWSRLFRELRVLRWGMEEPPVGGNN